MSSPGTTRRWGAWPETLAVQAAVKAAVSAAVMMVVIVLAAVAVMSGLSTTAVAQTAAPASTPAADRDAAPSTAKPNQPTKATPARLPAEAFFKSPAVLKAQLSPSGRQLAFTSAAGANRVALVIAATDGSGKLVRAALFNDVDVQEFHWVNEQRLIFSVVDLAAGSGEDYSAAPGLYGINPDGTDLRPLVARRPRGFVSAPQTVGRDTLPYNHVLLQVPLPRDDATQDEVIIGRLDIDKNGEVQQVVPLWLNTRSGRTRSMELQAPSNTLHWIFDARGEARIAESLDRAANRSTVYWRGAGQSAWKSLTEGQADRMPFAPAEVDNNGHLYVSRRSGPQGYSVLTTYDFDRKAPSDEPLVSVDGFDYQGGLLSSANGATIGVRTEADATVTVWFDDKMKAFQKTVDERFRDGVNVIDCRRCGEPDMVALVQHLSDRDPGQLWVYRETGRQWNAVARQMPEIDPAQMASVALERIKARDGSDLPVWLTLPAGRKAGAPGPAVVMVHGGPWLRGGHWAWQPMEQFLASRGYLVISPEFRGSMGYGEKHYRAGFKQWGRAMQDDVADAVRWAQKEGLADQRVCIAGASYGGYATLMGLAKHPELYRCGVAWVAVTDLPLMVEGSWFVRDDIGNSSRQFSLPEMVGDPKKEADLLIQASPVTQAARIKAPLLLAFGEDDLRVPLAHGKRMREALQKAGNDPVWITYPGEGHGWRLPKNQTDFATRVEKFLGEHLK